MAKKEEDYRVTRGKALIAEKKRVAANPQKGVGLPSKKNVVNAAKQIGGVVLTVAGPGKVVKGVQAAAKVAKAVNTAKAGSKALKAAQGPSLAKGAAKTAASSGKYERNIVKITAKANQEKGLSRKEAYAKASKTQDNRNAISVAESKKILARAKAEKDALAIANSTKSPKLSNADTKKFTSQIDKDAANYKAAKKAGN